MRSKALIVLLLGVAVVFAPRRAAAFCGFYVAGGDTSLFNNATMVVMMRDGQRTVLSMQNNYQGPPSNFAMVVPVPVVLQKENVKTLPRDIFKRIDQLAAPRLVEYWEQDPCAPATPLSRLAFSRAASGGGVSLGSGGGDLGVTIEAKFSVGEYQILILSAKDSTGLDTWLKQEKYKIPDGAEAVLRPYVQSGMKFFVAKVDVSKVEWSGNQAMLSPLRFHYDTDTFTLPIRLGLLNSGGVQDLIVHILAKGQRYEVANYKNVTIPTNLDVNESARDEFAPFYAALFDATLDKNPASVVTEYAWDASSCDPCPTPALTPSELATLGADVLPDAFPAGQNPSMPRPPIGGPRRIPRFWSSGFVLTRLHVRYGKEALGEDLVFRTAPPIQGGRELMGANGAPESGAKPSGMNNFQGRYAIRHPWSGPIACQSPKRGVWGGPPPSVTQGSTAPKAAVDLAFVKREGLQLAGFLSTPVPEPGVSPVASVAPSAAPSAPAPAPSSEPRAARSRCGLEAPGQDGAPELALVAGFGFLGVAVLRRRRKSSSLSISKEKS
jgi:hypothetical protein